MHISALVLDELALGALGPDAAAQADAHLEACAACRADRDTAQALREHFTREVLARTSPGKRRGWLAPRRARWAWLAVPVLAAAALALVYLRPAPAPPGLAPDLAIKGDATWQLFARRDQQTFAVHDGTVLVAGDRVRFVVIPDGARYLLVVSVDGAGAVSTYFPFGGTASASLEPGARLELPDSIVLDSAPGPERVFALFSDEPIAVAAVQDQLRTIAAGGARTIRETRTLDAKVRAQTSLVFEKAGP